ncbi:MAG TPA: hypothetical protein VIU87_04565 [Mycobacterium sp.]
MITMTAPAPLPRTTPSQRRDRLARFPFLSTRRPDTHRRFVAAADAAQPYGGGDFATAVVK